jgi:hypothetical protein
MVVWGCGGGGRDNRVTILKMVTKAEHQLIDLNTAPRLLTDREGELILNVLWSYVKDLSNCGDYDRIPALDRATFGRFLVVQAPSISLVYANMQYIIVLPQDSYRPTQLGAQVRHARFSPQPPQAPMCRPSQPSTSRP